MKNNNHFLSVIIPIYKQEKTIKQDLLNINETLKQIRYDYEIIAVVDGTSIDKSFSEIKKIKLPNLKVFGYKHNHGKGYAVRYGMAKTKGDYIAFIDSGMEIDPNGISLVLEHMEWYNADIIVASKRHPASMVKYPPSRKIVSFGAHIISKFLLGINVHDTQAGLKIFKRPVLVKVLPRLMVKNYAFDLEILAVANKLGFTKIYEAPIKLTYDFSSLTHATGLKIIYSCFMESMSVFYRLRILNYYDDKNKRKWIYNPELDMRINTGK
ncbi:MAG: glycosyltransferase family 2 protein [Candidatus Shapirobacteria bacterium]|nr:glycosyltransferase family 2 protein [Candidatus Shapirobacteria bacterium]MDD4410542.1 glycosyltransferase family 2 protein [Candidatus Shapirobacteria bacterium]